MDEIRKLLKSFNILIDANRDICIEKFEKIHKSKLFHILNYLLLMEADYYKDIDLNQFFYPLVKLTTWAKRNEKIYHSFIESKSVNEKNKRLFIFDYICKTTGFLEILDKNEFPEDYKKSIIEKRRKEICDFINQLPSNLDKEIWRSLYLKCANGKIEDNWSEHHFHEHLDELDATMKTVCEQFYKQELIKYNYISKEIKEKYKELSDYY